MPLLHTHTLTYFLAPNLLLRSLNIFEGGRKRIRGDCLQKGVLRETSKKKKKKIMEIARKAYPDCLIRDGLVSHWDQRKQKYFVLMEFGGKCSSKETLAVIALSLFLQVFSFFLFFLLSFKKSDWLFLSTSG